MGRNVLPWGEMSVGRKVLTPVWRLRPDRS